jgi:hypothetical protein
MKNLKIKAFLIAAAMGLLSYNTMAQKATDQIPQRVLVDFSAKYPQAQLKNWKVQNNEYVASFVLDKRDYTAKYAKDENWLSTTREVRHMSSLPPDIRASLKNSRYASWYIDGIETMKTPAQVMYLLHLDNDGGNEMVYENVGSVVNTTLYFNDKGTLIKSVNSN